MIHYVVAAGAPDTVDRIRARLSGALDATRVADGEHLEHVGSARTWAVAAISAPDQITSTRLVANDDSFVVVNGTALATSGDSTSLAHDALGSFCSGGTASVASALGGTYNFVGASPSQGLRALGDFSGFFPLYWHQGPDVAVFSNRSTTVAHAVGSSGWDVRALGWVIGHGNLFGERMPARDVAYLPPGREARADWGDGRVSLSHSPSWLWPEAGDPQGRENLSDDEWNEVTDALVTNFRALRTFEGPLLLPITGGKDSRLCLALAKAAGLQDVVETFTSGREDSPEVESATVVARTAGFSHRLAARTAKPAGPDATPTAPPPKPPFDADDFWGRLRRDIYRHESIVTPWSGMVDPVRRRGVTIKGFGGEFYRRGNSRKFRRKHMATVDSLASMFVNYHQVRDPLDIIQSDEAAFQTEWLRAWVYETAAEVRLDLLPEKFYVDYRLGHWNGPMAQSRPEALTVNPLLSSTAARKNLELSMEARQSERFHFEVMRRTAPELVAVPFLGDTWASEIADDSSVELPREPFPTSVKPTTRVLTQDRPNWRFLAEETRSIGRLFRESARHTDMGDVCKMWRLRWVTRKAPQMRKIGRVKEMFSAIGVALTLLERAEPVVEQVRTSAPAT